MQTEPLSPARIDALLAYLDGFVQRSVPFAEWHGGRQPDGSFRLPTPVYAPDVIAFFHELKQPWWQDSDHSPRQAGAWLDHPELIQTAGYARIRTMLTYCLRGEELSSGHWERMLNSGKLIAVLQRLRCLRRTQPLPAENGAPTLANAQITLLPRLQPT